MNVRVSQPHTTAADTVKLEGRKGKVVGGIKWLEIEPRGDVGSGGN